ncbi:hypothetical protein SAMN05444278_102156 [Psychroflexus salarius]|uniref:Fructosamine-3-kinase n=1 Tax=Psychroflexus salarius TaxID=1155689 RepID=A0A1M4U2C5_9FLAO|nr:fructosamine kinase family protein [Psychroflexus salarius]SHE50971.1 hypothetical protein SAMN05444278_102156 [Psychroflexus salarius]
MRELLLKITQKHQLKLKEIKLLTGGDINQVFKLTCHEGLFVLKLNQALKFPKMLQLEAKALSDIAISNSFKIPNCVAVGEYHQFQYLIIDYISNAQPTNQAWYQFGEQLAQLHQKSQSKFGYNYDNYIGELTQYNSAENTALDFYINQRIKPQLELAQQNKFQLKNTALFLDRVKHLVPEHQPSFIHGDLWSGNYLYHKSEGFYLIDPAVSFSLPEFDLAMMQLFGGFPSSVFEAYRNSVDASKLQLKHLDLFQLYYLLVHLNLFGQSYFSACQNIINKYT